MFNTLSQGHVAGLPPNLQFTLEDQVLQLVLATARFSQEWDTVPTPNPLGPVGGFSLYSSPRERVGGTL
jgi:hypothetical protein